MHDRQVPDSNKLIVPKMEFDPLLAPEFFIEPPAAKIAFPLPTPENFSRFYQSKDGTNYKHGATDLLEKLKIWAEKNAVINIKNIDEFVKNITAGEFVNLQESREFFLLYSEGLQLLYDLIEDIQSNLISIETRKKIIQDLVKNINTKNADQVSRAIQLAHDRLAKEFEIKFPLPNVEMLGNFLTTDDGRKYIFGVIELINKLQKWADSNNIKRLEPDPLRIFIRKLSKRALTNQDEKEFNQIYTDGIVLLAKILKKIHSESTPIKKRKDIVENLIKSFDVCGPGVLTHLEEADSALSSDLPNLLKNIRDKITRAVIDELRQTDTHWEVFAAHEGMEIHQVNTVSNLYARRLGIPYIIDGYAFPVTGENHFLYDLAYKNFPAKISGAMTAEAVINQLAGRMLDDVQKILKDIDNENFEGIKDSISATLDFYGKDETFAAGTLILLDEDAKMEGRIELKPEKFKNPKELELILSASLLLRLAEKKYFDLSKIKVLELKTSPIDPAEPEDEFAIKEIPVANIPDANCLKFAYITLSKPPAPIMPLISYIPKMDAEDLKKIITNIKTFSEALLYLPTNERNDFIDKMGKDFVIKNVSVSDLINSLPLDTHKKILGYMNPEFLLHEKREILSQLAIKNMEHKNLPEEATYLRKINRDEYKGLKTRLDTLTNYMNKHLPEELFNELNKKDFNKALESFNKLAKGHQSIEAVETVLQFIKGKARIEFLKTLDNDAFKSILEDDEEMISLLKSLDKKYQDEFFKLPAIIDMLSKGRTPDGTISLIIADPVFLEYFGRDKVKTKINSLYYFWLLLFKSQEKLALPDNNAEMKKYLKDIITIFTPEDVLSNLLEENSIQAYSYRSFRKKEIKNLQAVNLATIITADNTYEEIFKFLGKENVISILKDIQSFEELLNSYENGDDILEPNSYIFSPEKMKFIINFVGEDHIKSFKTDSTEILSFIKSCKNKAIFEILRLLDSKYFDLERPDLVKILQESSDQEAAVDFLGPDKIKKIFEASNFEAADTVANFIRLFKDDAQLKIINILGPELIKKLCPDYTNISLMLNEFCLKPKSRAAFLDMKFFTELTLKPDEQISLMLLDKKLFDLFGMDSLKKLSVIEPESFVQLLFDPCGLFGIFALASSRSQEHEYQAQLLDVLSKAKNVKSENFTFDQFTKIARGLNEENTARLFTVVDLNKIIKTDGGLLSAFEKHSYSYSGMMSNHLETSLVAKLMAESFFSLDRLKPYFSKEKFEAITQAYTEIKYIQSLTDELYYFSEITPLVDKTVNQKIIDDTQTLLDVVNHLIESLAPPRDILKFIFVRLEKQFDMEQKILRKRFLIGEQSAEAFVKELNSDSDSIKLNHPRFLANLLNDIMENDPSIKAGQNEKIIKAITIRKPIANSRFVPGVHKSL